MKYYERKVFYYETDKMAVVHHSNYLRIFEEARIYYLAEIGASNIKIEENGILVPVIEGTVQYKQSLAYGDEFYVMVKLVAYNGVRMKLSYKIIRKGDDALIATGHTCNCFCDGTTRIPLNLKKRLPEISAHLMNALEEDFAE